MKKICFALAALLLLWACSMDEYCDGPWLTNEGHSDCLLSTDAEYLATKEIQTDSIVVVMDYRTIHIEHHNMYLDCGKNPTFHNYLSYAGDTLVVHEDVGEQGQTDCVCLYDNWMDVEGVDLKYKAIKIVKDYSFCGNPESLTVYESGLWMELF